MRKKLKSEAGITLVELLAATVILMLLGLILSAGLNMALSGYRSITAQSEAELLLSTAVDALADDLRYARNVSGEAGDFTYTSDSFGPERRLSVNSAGQIVAYKTDADTDGLRLLPTGAYGVNGAYRVQPKAGGPIVSLVPPDDTPEQGDRLEISFKIDLTVTAEDGSVKASTPDDGVTVRCLNPMIYHTS